MFVKKSQGIPEVGTYEIKDQFEINKEKSAGSSFQAPFKTKMNSNPGPGHYKVMAAERLNRSNVSV